MPDRREELVRKMVLEGTSDDDIRATLKAFDEQPPPAAAPVTQSPRMPGYQMVADVAKGFAKGAASSVAGLGEMAVNAGMIPGQIPSAFGGQRHPALDRIDTLTTASNTPQMVGKGLEAVGEMALPAVKAVEAIPSAARAGRAFQSVMGAAKDIPIDPEAAGQVGLRIMQLTERGGGNLPRPVSQFLQWVTNPDKAPMTYEVARDFASGISKLSANEAMRMSPTVAREVAELRVVLNKAVAEAAGKAGKGLEYSRAMTEYAKSMKLRGLIDDVVKGAKRVAPYATAAGAGTWLTQKMLTMLGKD